MSILSRLFQNKAPGPILIAIFALLFILALATTCRAEALPSPEQVATAALDENESFSARRGVRIDAELGYTVFRARTPQAGLTVNILDVGNVLTRDFDLQLGVGVIGSYEYKGGKFSNQLYVQALIVDGFGKLDLGVGGVYLQNTDALNGSNANFSLLAAWRFGQNDSWKATFRHFSNASTAMPNYGRDILTLVRSF